MMESQLIILARQGDSVAFLRLFQKYQPIVFKMQGEYYLKDLEPEDWRQEGQIVFFKTLKCYDTQLGVSLGLFFKINFERHIYSMLRRQGAEKRKTYLISSSLEKGLEKHGETYLQREPPREDMAFGYVYLRESLVSFSERLSLLESKVFLLYLKGYEKREISSQLQVRENQVNNALDRVKAKLKETLD